MPSGNAPKNTTVKVTNSGTTPHSFEIVKLNDGKTLDDAKTYFDTLFNTGKAPEGDAPAVLVGGVESVTPNGGVGYLELDPPGGQLRLREHRRRCARRRLHEGPPRRLHHQLTPIATANEPGSHGPGSFAYGLRRGSRR